MINIIFKTKITLKTKLVNRTIFYDNLIHKDWNSAEDRIDLKNNYGICNEDEFDVLMSDLKVEIKQLKMRVIIEEIEEYSKIVEWENELDEWVNEGNEFDSEHFRTADTELINNLNKKIQKLNNELDDLRKIKIYEF